MITSENIMLYFESRLNSIAQTNGIEILFKGGLDVVDEDYRRRLFGVQYTPFSLATQRFEPRESNNIVDFRYSLYAMAFETDRELAEFIMDELYITLSKSFMIGGWQLKAKPINLTYGGKYTEGSGTGIERFEILLQFDGVATKYLTNADITLMFDDMNVPITSFKYDSGKVSYINKTSVLDSGNNHNLNSNVLVIESPLSLINDALNEFIGSRQKVNIEKHINLKVGDVVVIDDLFEFEGYTISSSSTQDTLSAYLYFSYASDKTYIIIDDEEIPILDYAIAMKSETIPHNTANSNTGVNIWLGEAKAYSFNISEDYEYEVMNKLMNNLTSDIVNVPIYFVTMNIKGLLIEKTFVLDEIVKESRETSNSVLRVTFVESGELSG